MQGAATTANEKDVYSTNSKQVLVTRDPVYTHPTIRQGQYIGAKPHNYLTFAIFTTIINPVVGPIAILFAKKSDTAYKNGDVNYSMKWSNHAFLTGMIAIVTSVILGVVIAFTLIGPGVSGRHSYWAASDRDEGRREGLVDGCILLFDT